MIAEGVQCGTPLKQHREKPALQSAAKFFSPRGA